MTTPTSDPKPPLPSISSPPKLHTTIRFTTSIPDLPLDIPFPSKTTVISLKHQIRSSLPSSSSTRRLRLIYAGKLLPDNAVLTSVLKIPPPPPRLPPDPKSKGKGKGRDVEIEEVEVPRIYINCSIGDPLTAAELAAEAAAAATSSTTSLTATSTTGTSQDFTQSTTEHTPTPSTTLAPRGFDRLLSSGFTPAEVGQLRLQFLSIQSSIHTPDTMPSPTTLRRMEDAWIDDNGAGAGTGTGGGGAGRETDMAGGALDDLLWGHVIGFLWPLGAMAWLSREEGVWSARRQTAVWSGFVLCLAFGVMGLLA